jgi:hypothetical protein
LNDKEIIGFSITLQHRAGYVVGVEKKNYLVRANKFMSNRGMPLPKYNQNKGSPYQCTITYNTGCPCQSRIKTRDAHTNAQ